MQARQLRLASALAAALLLVAIALGALLLQGRLRDTARINAGHTVERVARVGESTVNRLFLAVDGALAGLGPLLIQAGDDRMAANRLLRDLNFQNLNFRDLVLVRADGSPWASALAPSRARPPPVDPARLAEALQSATVIVTGPARNPLTGEWALFLVRGLRLPAAGDLIAIAEVQLPLIGTLLSAVGEVPGLRISVETSEGRLLVSLPHDEPRTGQRLPPASEAMPTDGAALDGRSRLDGRPVIRAARPLLYRDIRVVVTYDTAAALGDYGADRLRLLLAAGGAGILVLLLALALDAALRQRERIEAERAAGRALLENAIESLPDGFVMFDADDRLVVCNQRYRDFYAISAPFIRPGASFSDIIREGARRGQYPQAGADIEAFVAEIKAWHRSDQPPIERLLPDGRWLLVTERRTPNGGTVGIRTDITALKRANADLAQARDAAAAATEAKSRFLARMSHELRTPLNGVLGLAQALTRDPALSGEQRERARTLEAAGRHAVAVANDVLDLARVEAGHLDLRAEPTDLRDLLQGCATLIRAAATEKRIGFNVELDAGLPRLVEADQTRLRQLLLNLLSNAVKFTPHDGRISLAGRAVPRPTEDGRQVIRVEVRDTGPGVPPAMRAAVFGDFVQLDRGEAGGSGLGLAIVAGIVRQMEGSCGCDANLDTPDGRGAVFWVELPLRPVAAPPEDAVRATPAAPPPGLRVLVADDVPANLAVARALLESAGLVAHCVADGQQAVTVLATAAAARPFDVVLMDVMMPEMDGLAATRAIRALPGPESRVPILGVTAGAFAEDIAACRAAGMDAHLAKPIEREALLAALARLVAGDAAEAAPPAEPATPWAGLPLLARRGSLAMSVPGLAPAAAAELTAEFIVELRSACNALADAATAKAAGAAAHRLAGAAATLGAPRLAIAARAFQSEARLAELPALAGSRGTLLALAGQTLAALQPAATPAAAEPATTDA